MVARPMLGGLFIMKDLLFVAVAGGFFIVTWLYARSFDRL